MQTDSIASSPAGSEVDYAELARGLRALMARIGALQALVYEDEEGDGGERAPLDLPRLHQGLSALEEMAGELLYRLEAAGGTLPLAAVPGPSLTEALSQLVETTAEELTLSSRLVLPGREHPLADYPSRLLYRVAQEALARVHTHEGARRLRFSLDYQRAGLVMSIEDDGVPGTDEESFAGAAGETPDLPPFLVPAPEAEREERREAAQTLRRLRAMLENLGGSLSINSGVEQGVQIVARLPLHHPERAQEPTTNAPQKVAPADVFAKIKIIIVDGQAVSRAGLRRLLESYQDLTVVGEASDSVQAVSETAELLPQVVLIDAQLPGEQSLEALRQIHQLSGEIRVLLLASQENEALLYEALRAGANGYITKESAPDELAQSVRAAARGEVLVQPQLAARLLTRFGERERNARSGTPQESLTAREQEVLQLLARGLRNKEIAARLFVSERTVNFHLANIYAKLRVSGRTEALSKALEQGLLR